MAQVSRRSSPRKSVAGERRAEVRGRDDAERQPRAAPRKLEQRAVLGDEKARARGERRLEELLVVGIAAHRQLPALALGQPRLDALRQAPALRDARLLRLGIERALGETPREHARE